MTEQRHTADTITDDALDELHDRAEQAEAELAAARAHTSEQGKVIARLLLNIGEAEQQLVAARSTLDRVRKFHGEMQARALPRSELDAMARRLADTLHEATASGEHAPGRPCDIGRGRPRACTSYPQCTCGTA